MENDPTSKKLSFELPKLETFDLDVPDDSAQMDPKLRLIFGDISSGADEQGDSVLLVKRKGGAVPVLRKRRRVRGTSWKLCGNKPEKRYGNTEFPLCNGSVHGNSRQPMFPVSKGLDKKNSVPTLQREVGQGNNDSVKPRNQPTPNGVLAGSHRMENGYGASDTTYPRVDFSYQQKASEVGSNSFHESSNMLRSKEHPAARNLSPNASYTPKRKALDILESLTPSLRIFLFPDGFARAERTPTTRCRISGFNDMNSAYTPSPKKPYVSPKITKNNVVRVLDPASLPRYPYDRSSRELLRSLELGLIPPQEDLPDLSCCEYYNGCLIAEISDRRRPDTSGTASNFRIVLRPDNCSFIADMNNLTDGLDIRTAMRVEEGIIMALRRNIDVRPTVLLPSAYRPCTISSPVSPTNLIYAPRRDQVPIVPRSRATVASNAALMLIANAEKYRQLVRHRDQAMKTIALLAQRGEREALSNAPQPFPEKPAIEAMPSASTDSKGSTFRSVRKLRTVVLVRAGKQGRAKLEEAQAEATRTGDSSIVGNVMREIYPTTAAGVKWPMYKLQLFHRAGEGCQCEIARGNNGEKIRDVIKVECGNEEDANRFVDQFIRVSSKMREGYHCLMDRVEKGVTRRLTPPSAGSVPATKGQLTLSRPNPNAPVPVQNLRVDGHGMPAPALAAEQRRNMDSRQLLQRQAAAEAAARARSMNISGGANGQPVAAAHPQLEKPGTRQILQQYNSQNLVNASQSVQAGQHFTPHESFQRQRILEHHRQRIIQNQHRQHQEMQQGKGGGKR